MATMQDIINGFKDPRTLKMPLSNTPEFNNPSPLTTFPLSGRPVQSVPFPKLDRSQPHTVNYWPTYGANDPSGGVPYLPAPMPKPMGVANAPGIGNYAPYGPTPNTGGDPNRLQPGGLPFINRPPLDITVRGGAPQTASVPMPRGRPGLNIQPFDQQFNLRDPGNEGYVDPVAAYAPPAPAATTEVIDRVRTHVPPGIPIFVKLSPDVTDIVQIARAAVHAGADALVMINTLLGLEIDTATLRPAVAGITGGLSGPAIRPVALRAVWQVYAAMQAGVMPTRPIVGVGGIRTGEDALSFLAAGASAVQVGTAIFNDPHAPIRVRDELGEELRVREIASPADVVGIAHTRIPGRDR